MSAVAREFAVPYQFPSSVVRFLLRVPLPALVCLVSNRFPPLNPTLQTIDSTLLIAASTQHSQHFQPGLPKQLTGEL
jgi:hypothetical protein